MSYFGKNIKKIRIAKNLSQTAFADIFNLKRTAVGAYEEGRAEAKTDTLIKISEYFKISIDILLKNEITVNEIFGISNNPISDKRKIPFISNSNIKKFIKSSGDKNFLKSLETIEIPIKYDYCTFAFEINDGILLTVPVIAGKPGKKILILESEEISLFDHIIENKVDRNNLYEIKYIIKRF